MATAFNASGNPNPGDVFTLAFTPSGLGDPFDNVNDWYSAVAKSGLPIAVTNVAMNGGLLTVGDIEVTVSYAGDGSDTYGSIGSAVATAAASGLLSFLYGYNFVGAYPGTVTTLSGSNAGLPGLPTGSSNTLLWIGVGVIALSIGVAMFEGDARRIIS